MTTPLHLTESVCDCGTPHSRFHHACPAIRGCGGIWIYGCPKCDDFCPECGKEPPPAPNRTDHLCTLDEAIYRLQQIRSQHGGQVGVMISFDGPDEEAMVPYMPVNTVALDDDEPGNVVALLCVSEGNHPFGNVVKMRPADWEWKPMS